MNSPPRESASCSALFKLKLLLPQDLMGGNACIGNKPPIMGHKPTTSHRVISSYFYIHPRLLGGLVIFFQRFPGLQKITKINVQKRTMKFPYSHNFSTDFCFIITGQRAPCQFFHSSKVFSKNKLFLSSTVKIQISSAHLSS